MGGHGGLNILPQKKWNVYNYDNRDIVQKDKKQHAQKMRKKYESDRRQKMTNKFQVLKEQGSENQQKQQIFKKQIKKDSLLTNQLKRLAQQNQHVNLFQAQQKLIQNRQVLQYHKLKQSEWLKEKNMDYSSKFLGTYNEDSKIPWYAKNKYQQNKSNNNHHNEAHKSSFIKPQRYDMDDLTDQIRLSKITNSSRYRNDMEKIKKYYDVYINHESKMHTRENTQNQSVKEQDSQNRDRSRNKKYQFLKRREQQQQRNKNSDQCKNTENTEIYNKIQLRQIKQVQQKDKQSRYLNQNDCKLKPKKQMTEQDKMRLKRLKRQQKQRKKAQQLRKKLAESISRT